MTHNRILDSSLNSIFLNLFQLYMSYASKFSLTIRISSKFLYYFRNTCRKKKVLVSSSGNFFLYERVHHRDFIFSLLKQDSLMCVIYGFPKHSVVYLLYLVMTFSSGILALWWSPCSIRNMSLQ